MKNSLIAIILSLALVFSYGAAPKQAQGPKPQQPMDEWRALEISLKNAQSLRPKDGFVPDESTAVKIGEAATIAQYGETQILGERPFHARLYGNIWIVKGTLHSQGAFGGTAVVKISKLDGKILFMTHQY